MPPWPPEPGYGDLAGARHLSDEQIALIQRWAARGRSGGTAGRASAAARLHGRLAARASRPRPRALARPTRSPPRARTSSATSSFRPPSAARATSARMELRPGDKRVVHHANVLLDRSGSARRRDARDRGPGLRGHGRGAGVGRVRAGQPLPVLEAGHGRAERAGGDGLDDRRADRPRPQPAPPALGEAGGDPPGARPLLHGRRRPPASRCCSSSSTTAPSTSPRGRRTSR